MNDRTNTIFGWILFSGIIALGLSSISMRIFHSEEPEQAGYFIEGAEEAGAAAAGPSLATLLATGDAAAGEAVFAKCTACHTIEQGGATGIGPNLYGVLGTSIGSHVPGFAYSAALAGHGGDWSYENMDDWLRSPRGFANGTKMSFAGLSNPEDRANVILYMLQFGGGPDLPTPEAPEAEAGELGEDFPGVGPGAVEGAPVEGTEAVGAMGDDQPVPESGAAVSND